MSPLALDVVIKTGKTPVLGRMLSKYVGRKTSSIENDITKVRNHSRQRGNIMRVVFGIDVSKASSEVPSWSMERKCMAISYPMMPSDLIDYLGT